MALFHMQTNVKSIDGKEMPLMTVIAESLKFIANRALLKLEEQIGKCIKKEKNLVGFKFFSENKNFYRTNWHHHPSPAIIGKESDFYH
jgi:hypothetical protein